MSLLFVYSMGNGTLLKSCRIIISTGSVACAFMSSANSECIMKQIIINHFHIHGNYIAGDSIAIHDNPFATFCQGRHTSTAPSPIPIEEVTPAASPQDAAAPDDKPSFFCCITQSAIDSGHAGQVEDELRSACVSAPKLVQCIRTNEALGYLDTQNLTSTELYNLLNDHFGLRFKLRCFTRYRNR